MILRCSGIYVILEKEKRKERNLKHRWKIIDGSRKNNFNFTKISNESLFNPFYYEQYMIQI